jgi:hypothetical protein
MSDGLAAEECVHPVARTVADLETMLGECAGLPLWSLQDKDIDNLVPQAYSLLGRVMGSLVLPLVREADRRDLATAFDAGNTAGWVRDVLRVTPAEARRMVGLAKVVDGDLAATGQALADGRISAEHAQVIARSVAELPEDAAEWVPAVAERDLLGMAEQYDPRILGKLGRRILTVVDPDRGDEILGRQLERQDKAAKEGRQLHATPYGDGRVRLTGWFDTEGWEIVRAALDPLAAPRPAGPGGVPDPRSYARRQADALVELAERSLRVGDLPEQGGERPTLVLTMPYSKLADQVGTAVLDTGERLPAATARRMACDARIVPAVLGGEGQILDLGRAARTVSGPLRRAVVLRDSGCTFPTCDIPPQWCIVHLIHWADGGPTTLTNSVLVCSAHHDTAHHSGWQVRIAADGIPEWIPPAHVDPDRKPRRHHRHNHPSHLRE